MVLSNMTRLKRWKGRSQTDGLHVKNTSAASVIIVPGVSADALDKQTCYHFEELIKNWCAAPNVWIYDHGVQLHTPQSWNAFCDCGEDLLSELLNLIEQQPQLEIVLIGHRLGAFILKKTLLLAYRRKHRERYISLFDALRTLVMVGEPYLSSEDRTQWSSLVQDSLDSTKGSMPETFSVDALSCLKYIEEMFEHLEINSQFFQVLGKPSKRKGIYRSRLKAKNCVCDGSVTVRMWTTQDDDEAALEGIEASDSCIFSHKSGWHQPLRLITAGEWGSQRQSIAGGNIPLALNGIPSIETESAGKETATCSPTHRAGTAATATLGVPFRPETDGQAMNKHDSVVAENHVCNDGHTTGSKSTVVTDNHDSEKNYPTASSSVDQDCDVVNEQNILPLESSDPRTSGIEDVDRFAGACPMSPQEMTSQPRNGNSFSTTPSTHQNFVEVPNTARHRSRPLPLRLSLPPVCKTFFPREDAATWLENLLFEENPSQKSKALRSAATTVGVLYGLGGVGKTQIALNFARSAEARFNAVFWLKADSEQSILQSFHDSAIALRLINGRRNHSHTQSAALCMKWLVESEARWLLIFDDVGNAETITPYIPHSMNGATIMTTRNAGLRFPDFILPVFFHVQPLSVTKSQSFLLECTQLEMEDVNSESGLELSKNSGGLPLVLDQIGNVIKHKQLSMGDLAALMKEAEHEEQSSKYERISTVWHISFKSLSLDARQLLACLSYMDPVAAPTYLVQACFEKTLVWEDPGIVDERLCAATKQLTRLALIDSGISGDAFKTHRLIQDSMRKSISRDEGRQTLRALTSVLGAQWPSDRKFRNVLHGFWADFDDVMNQFRCVVDHVSPLLWIVDALDEFVDESFPNTALRCLWYDRRVRGNNNNYANLAHFAAAAIALPRQRLKDSTQSTWKTPYMPRRLVYIDHRRQQWQLVDTGGRKLNYMAFSLGFSDEEGGPKLTKSNLPTFQNGVALARMPQAFRDACCVSGMLRTEYLWIDAICIDQRNDEETASEVGHMIDIYQHAVATISPRSLQDQHSQYGQVKWGRYDVLCGEISTSEQLGLLKARLTETDSFDSLASTIAPEIFSNIKSYVQGNMTVMSDAEPLLVFHARKCLTDVEAQPLLQQSLTPSNDINFTRIEDSLLSETKNEDTDRVAHSIATAWSRVDEAIVHFGQKNMLRAVTRLVQARELMRNSTMSSKDALRVDLQAAVYLARTFLIDGSADVAMNLLDNLAVPTEEGDSPDSNFATILAQFRIVKGDAHLANGNAIDAAQTYRENIDAAHDDQEGEMADLTAISKLRLSNCHLAQGEMKGAHTLIKETITYFEEQDSRQGQAQYARALYCQALVFKEEGKEKFKKRSMAAARQALEELCEEHDLAMPALDRELEKEDCESVIELRFL